MREGCRRRHRARGQRVIDFVDAVTLGGGAVRSVELFAGGGGLALGLRHAGFHPEVVVEWNRHACRTLRENQMALSLGDRLVEGDVRNEDFRGLEGKIDLLAGGPPCQPFSVGGKHAGMLDPRDMFPQMIRAVREIRPPAVLIENVGGLTRRAFASYLEYVLMQLALPSLEAAEGEPWQSHLARLRYVAESGGNGPDLAYRVAHTVVDVADYGVPQRRRRLVIVAFREDLDVTWSMPARTHDQAALLHDKWVTGNYWRRHGLSRPSGHPTQIAARTPGTEAWRTVRDGLEGLGDPRDTAGTASWPPNHEYRPGARRYPGHTGSVIDEPAKTIKAGVHGVPGGENTIETESEFRYMTVREAARLQTFPDDYVFAGSWTESMRQIGNAVPVALAEILGHSVRSALEVNKTALRVG